MVKMGWMLKKESPEVGTQENLVDSFYHSEDWLANRTILLIENRNKKKHKLGPIMTVFNAIAIAENNQEHDCDFGFEVEDGEYMVRHEGLLQDMVII